MQPITQRDRSIERAVAARQLSERLGHMPMSIANTITVACDVFGLTRFRVVSSQRHKSVVTARWAIMHVCYEAGYSSSQIGQRLGDRDHTTVLHGVSRARELYASDDEFRRRVDVIVSRLMVRSVEDE